MVQEDDFVAGFKYTIKVYTTHVPTPKAIHTGLIDFGCLCNRYAMDYYILI